jgi:hypothetical protein
MSRYRYLVLFSCLAAAALLAGCGKGRPATAAVSGTVTIRGRPVTAGTVLFVAADGTQSASAELSPEGTYTMPAAPVGPVRVAVQTATFRYRRVVPAGLKPPPGVNASSPQYRPVDRRAGTVYVPIPARYESPDQSGLSLTVERGQQTLDIALD